MTIGRHCQGCFQIFPACIVTRTVLCLYRGQAQQLECFLSLSSLTPPHPTAGSRKTLRTTQTSAVGVWKKAGSWLWTAALPDPGSVPEGPDDSVSRVRHVWSCVYCFCFGVTKISDRDNFQEARMTRFTVSEGCTWQSCPVHSSRGQCWSQGWEQPSKACHC